MDKKVRVRFAPSPTGFVHIGSLRTALYNYLFAEKMGGDFILRIEDTDRTRYVEGAIENLINSLHWAGIHYSEGVFIEDGKVVQKGDYGPYIQSERLDIYRKYVEQLIDEGKAYYCFCDKERLDRIREERQIKGLIPKYDGFCRNIPLDEAKKRVANGEPYVVRLKLPKDTDITFHDVVRGDITINTEDIDDQVLLKSDGFPTYHMAVVVDDHLMGITHIVRGEEWLPSTPKHVFLYEALGWEKPEYVHLPTVLNKDRKKLSKRQGDVSVEDFKDKGYLPEALNNYLALVGWSPEDNKEIFTMDELIKEFSFERVSKTGGIFDKDKLDWVNAQFLRNQDINVLREEASEELIKAGLITEDFAKNNKEYMEVLIDTLKDSISLMTELPEKAKFIFEELPLADETKEFLEGENAENAKVLANAIEEELSSVDEITLDYAKTFMKSIQKKTGIKGKNLYMPVRAMISFSVHGPEMDRILYLLGKEKIFKRLDKFK